MKSEEGVGPAGFLSLQEESACFYQGKLHEDMRRRQLL